MNAGESWKAEAGLVWVGMAVRKQAAVMVVAAGLSLVRPTLAQESPLSLERTFWSGASAGAPSHPKQAVVASLYVLSAAALGATGYFAYTWAEASADVRAKDSRGVCFELATPDCRQLIDAQADLRGAQRYTAASAAATAGFLLSGVVVAQYWGNTVLGVGVSPRVASLQFTIGF